MSYDREAMASNLRGLRASKRLTQADVARAVGVSTATIANYENGEGSVSYEIAWALADLFEVSLDSLGSRFRLTKHSS